MDKVYRDAEEVIIWLGEEAEDSELALDTIEVWACWKESKCGDGRGIANKDHLRLAIDRLLQRPFWTRLWVLQEVVLA